jgi:alanyl-tRNA synthetase
VGLGAADPGLQAAGKDKLWATVYIDDDEAYDIWTKEIGLPPERVVRIGDNKGASTPATTSG